MILTVTMNPAVDKVYKVNDIKINNVYRPKNMIATAGGKGLNVARVVKELTGKVSATGLMGGSNAEFIKNELEKEGITNKFVDIKGNTRTCINIMDQKNNTSTEILEPGPYIKNEEINTFLTFFENIINEYNIIIASGSLPKGLTDDFYQKIIEISKKNEKIFLLDSSGDYLLNGISSKPYMIKPNEDEVEHLFEHENKKIESYASVLIKLQNQGIKLPVITLGEFGCICLIENEIYQLIPPSVEVKNSVGSGDAFMGGCGVGLDNGLSSMESLKLGLACGTANTQFLKTGKISNEKVNKIKNKIKVKKIR
ncbi:MAG: tagatose 6-phosphate kinase [Candidatus Frackibacter sp. T328-2]|nr:MAG: tagatose 6-phosphate kinase [Candidatus Frackibacter sp. T328-2]